jgi:hypothetical protein
MMGVYDEVKMTVPMIVCYVHSYRKKGRKNVTHDVFDNLSSDHVTSAIRLMSPNLYYFIKAQRL